MCEPSSSAQPCSRCQAGEATPGGRIEVVVEPGDLALAGQGAAKFFSLVFPLAMVAETFVPVETMPGWLVPVAEWNPLSATVVAARELFGNPAGPGQGWVAQDAVLLTLFVPLAVGRFRRMSR